MIYLWMINSFHRLDDQPDDLPIKIGDFPVGYIK